MQISDKAAEYVRRSHPPEQSAYLLAAVDRFAAESYDDPDRITVALSVLVRGGTSAHQAVALAETDWRDLLMAADLAHGDWPERVAAILAE